MLARAQSLALLLLAAALLPSKGQVVIAESPAFTLDTRHSSGSAPSVLVATAESAAFTLDTRLAAGNPTFDAFVVTAESATFVLDTRLSGKLEALIVEAVSPRFKLNTMWLAIRRTARPFGSPLELYWPTNAPGFYPQSALPPLGPSMQWQDVPNSVSESNGLYRTQFPPEGTERYFRLRL